MRCALIIAAGLVLAAQPVPAAATSQEQVARLTLVPGYPGGELASAPVYGADELTEVIFDIHLDNRLRELDVTTYLEVRTRLLAARYAIWLYRFDAAGAAGPMGLPSPTLVITPDSEGRFPLAAPAIAPGKLYAWQVVATLDGGGSPLELWSTLLYFRTTPAESVLPALIPAEHRETARRLLLLMAQQRREQAGLAATLRGLPLYSNYPSASDIYFCTPTAGECSCPLPVPATVRMPAAQLVMLGEVMERAFTLRERAAHGEGIAAELTSLSDDVYRLVNKWPGVTQEPLGAKVSILAAVAEKLMLAGANPGHDQAPALLSGLLVAIDELAGTGTIELSGSYEVAFLGYAAAASAHLEQLAVLQPGLAALLGEEEAQRWLDHFRRQQEQLQSLADEVSRGRLAKSQLSARIAELRAQGQPPWEQEFRYLVEDRCLVDLDRIKRLTPADTEQVARLSIEVATCHLQRLAGSIWPEPPPGTR